MARRRKKTARNAASRQKAANNNNMLDKSLPSLPSSAVPTSAFVPEHEMPRSEVYSNGSNDLLARSRLQDASRNGVSQQRREPSPGMPIGVGKGKVYLEMIRDFD